MGLLRAWWQLFKGIGSGAKAGRQVDQLFRYYVLKTLDDIGFFAYVQGPKPFGTILTEFGFSENSYTMELFSTLSKDPKGILTERGGLYTLHPGFEMPDLERALQKSYARVRPFIKMAEVMAANILERLREEPAGVREIFEREDHRVTEMFRELLSSGSYSTVRSATFAYLPQGDRDWLRGKHLLEIGCGSGLETAEIWLAFGGDVHITAVDAVPRMVDLARTRFEALLDELDPDHPPVTEANRPRFEEGQAQRLPFADGTFDAAFMMFVLHWTPDPGQAIAESVRVVRPGGLLFGAQAYRPLVNPYMNLVIRSSRNSYGFCWREDLLNWYREIGVDAQIATPAGILLARKPA
jgi:ubiquinone/menaquinone biosynthesis C-methylase UbiE